MKLLRLSILCAVAVAALGITTYLVAANNPNSHKAHFGAAKAGSSPLANATVSFGAWMTPLDRFSNVPPPPPTNHHVVLPQVAQIKAGGTVNFIISGLHNIAIYDDGTRPEDINTSLLDTSVPPVPVIDDPNRRIYRGLDPRKLLPALDRVEVVHFSEPGTYLVICGVLPHFQEGMYGFVKVVP
jgi:plastocyanin